MAGTRYTAWFGRMRSPSEILHVDRPRLVKTRFGSWLLRGVEQTTFEDQGHGTRLTQEFWTKGIISAVMARIFAFGSYKGSFQGELKSLLGWRSAKPVLIPKEGRQLGRLRRLPRHPRRRCRLGWVVFGSSAIDECSLAVRAPCRRPFPPRWTSPVPGGKETGGAIECRVLC